LFLSLKITSSHSVFNMSNFDPNIAMAFLVYTFNKVFLK
jgi:hypothetical protein